MAAPTVGTLNGGPAVIGFPYFGYLEGNPTASIDAQFHTPIGLALDSTGNYLYVADRDNNAIRVVDLASSSTHYNLTFTFVPDEFTPPNTISSPVGVALDAEDNLYVLNRGNGKNGTVLRFDYYGDFTTVALALTNANGMALDYANNIYVTISSNSLLKIPSGAINVTPGAANTTVVNYNFPAKTSINNANTCLQGIVVMDDGRIAACDSGNHGIVLINPDTHTNSLLTGFNGAGDYTGVNNRGATTNTAKFLQPYGLAKAGKGILVVSDYGNNRVKVVNSFGAVTNLYGVSSSYWYMGPGSYPGWWDGTVVVPDGEGDVEAREPRGLLLAPNGTIYVTEDYYHLIRTVAGADLPPVPPPPPPPPATPTILVVLTNYGQVSLTWSASAGASGYNVKRSPSSLGPFATIANTASTNFTDGSVLNGTTYYYVVSAVGAGGESPDSAPVSARTPLPPVDDPVTGYVDFPPIFFTSVFHPVSSIVFNNDTRIVIVGEPGSQTFYEYGPTGGSIPDPTSASHSAPVGYQDGLSESQVDYYIIPQQLPDLTIKAIGEKFDGSPNSAVVEARFQFITANPIVDGNNAAQFTVSDLTTDAQMWYTVNGDLPTNAAPSVGPISSGTTLSLQFAPGQTNITFKVRAFRDNYQPSAVVPVLFSSTNFAANTISFGFASGEASSDFIGAPGQIFYAPVTLSPLPGTPIYSLQFNLTVTNAGWNAGPAVASGAYGFQSFLEKPIPGTKPVIYERIPPYMFAAYAVDPPPAGQIINYDGLPFLNMVFTNSALNLLGVGWLERLGQANLYDTTKQTLITYSQAHDTMFSPAGGKVILGGYAFQIPSGATPGQTYQIQIGRPSATSDGVGAPGSDVYIAAPITGSLTNGALNATKVITVGQRKYLAGDCVPFRWFNAGDFGNTNLDNGDVMQVFQSAIYRLNNPPPGSDFFDSMDSCGGTYTNNLSRGYLEFNTLISDPVAKNALFDCNDTNINQIAFGDGVLDVCDVYVTFRRSLDPSLTLFRRFWTNGVRAAEWGGGAPVQASAAMLVKKSASVNFASPEIRASAGQTLQIPITAQILGDYSLRVLMLGLSVEPLDGSPALTSPIQFTPNAALGAPTISSSIGEGNYAATWLNSTIAGLTGNATLGTLTVSVPGNAPSTAAYAVHFDHASASPNGIASFAKQTLTGLILLSDRSSSIYGDGIPDSWRLRYFGTVNNVLSQATADADGDGASNWQEYVAGTDPTDLSSILRVSTAQNGAQHTQDCVVRWPSVAGKRYVIERSTSVFSPNWIPISTNTGSGSDMEYHDTASGAVRFFRVQVTP